MVKPAAMKNTRNPLTRNMKVVKMKPISCIGGVRSASCARPGPAVASSMAAGSAKIIGRFMSVLL